MSERDVDGFGPEDLSDALGANVSRETIDRLKTYVELLRTWSKVHNLIGPTEIERIWHRHILDSLQVWAIHQSKERWVDIGSGAGLPGVVIGCALAEFPGKQITLIEPIRKRASFLAHVSRETSLPVTVICDRAENVEPFRADIVTARAVTNLTNLLHLTEIWTRKRSVVSFLKGKHWEEELTQAQHYWNFNHNAVTSKSDSHGRILTLTEIDRV